MNLRPALDLAALALLSAATAWSAIAVSEWKFQQTFEAPTQGVLKLTLPVETLDLSRPGLADLRILAPNGDEIPYLADVPTDSATRTLDPQHFRVRLTRTSTEITLVTGTEAAIDAIALSTNASDFVKPAHVETSADGTTWQTLVDGAQLSRTHARELPTLAFGGMKAAHVRITIDDWRSAPITFTGARLVLASSPATAAVSTAAQITKRDEFLGETVLTLDLGARNLPLADLEIETSDALLSREIRLTQTVLQNSEPVEDVLASGRIERGTAARENAIEQLRVPINATATSRQLSLHILNGDNAPLSVSKVLVRRRPVAIVFYAPAAGTHTLLTGHPHAAAPRYDLARFVDELTRVAPSDIAVTPARPNPQFHSSATLSDVPLLAAAIDRAPWKRRKPVSTATAEGVHQLELDLETLSRAQPSLADLRLVSGDRQTPFLLERTALFRTVPLTTETADDPASPRQSRWKVSLPHAGAAIQRLTLDSPTALFSREVRVYEIAPDSRGEPYERPLTHPLTWTRAPGKPRAALALTLLSRPETESLYVEIANGDNPPIALGAAAAGYPVSRLLFRAPGSPLELLYGNPIADAPSYDLAIVADQFARSERLPATLGAESSSRSAANALLSSARGGAILWISLGLVVVVLLVVIARLLPKTPPAS